MRSAITLLCVLVVCTASVAGASPAIAQSSAPQVTDDRTIFERIDSDNAGMVIQLDLSLLTSGFDPGSTLRVVTGGTANGERVVWLDIGIGYRGGPVLPDPMQGFVVRAQMTLNLPA